MFCSNIWKIFQFHDFVDDFRELPTFRPVLVVRVIETSGDSKNFNHVDAMF